MINISSFLSEKSYDHRYIVFIFPVIIPETAYKVLFFKLNCENYKCSSYKRKNQMSNTNSRDNPKTINIISSFSTKCLVDSQLFYKL